MIFKLNIVHFLFRFLSLTSVAFADLICGTLGYHNETTLTYYMGNFFYNGLTTFTLCAAYCQQDTRCVAFRYSYYSDANSQYCEFFDTSIAGSFTADDTSPYYYYDIGCTFPPFETPTTVTSLSTLTSLLTVTSSRINTVTSLLTTIATLPAVIRTSTAPGATYTVTQTATTFFVTTQTLAAQIRTVTASFTATATVTATVSATRTLPVTTTVLYPVTATATRTVLYPVTTMATATATATVRVTAIVTATQTATVSATRTLLATTTILYPVTATKTNTALYAVTATVTATVTAQAQVAGAQPAIGNPPPPPPVTRFLTRTVTETDIRYLRTVTAIRTVTVTRRF